MLAFHPSQIMNKSNDAISEVEAKDKAEVEEESDPRGVERKEPDGREDDENNIVDVRSEDAMLGYNSFSFKTMLEVEVQDLRIELDAKDEVIEGLRTKLNVRDDVIERQKIELKKMEKKYYELQDQFKKNGAIMTSSCIHQE